VDNYVFFTTVSQWGCEQSILTPEIDELAFRRRVSSLVMQQYQYLLIKAFLLLHSENTAQSEIESDMIVDYYHKYIKELCPDGEDDVRRKYRH
jgi:hypothetical protein